MRTLLTSFLLVCLTFSGLAQSDWMWQQYHYFGDTTRHQAGLWLTSEYSILSNQITNEIIREATFDGLINSSSTEYIDDLDPDGYTRLAGGYEGDLWFRSGLNGKWRFLFGTTVRDHGFASIRNGLAQLYLRGNGPSAGKELQLGPSEVIYHSYQTAGFGLEHNTGKTMWGFTVHAVKSSRYAHAVVHPSTFFTEENGVSVEADYRFQYDFTGNGQGKAAAWYGTGYQLNAFFVYQPSQTSPVISFEFRDFGQVFYQGVNRYKADDSLGFNGVDVQNVLQLDDSLINGSDIDSLGAILSIEERNPFVRAWLPAYVNVNYVHPLGEKARINVGLKQYITFGLPEFRLGVAYQPAPWIAIEPRIRVGGFTRFDFGLNVGVMAGEHLQVILKTEQFDTWIFPKSSTSQALFAGVNLRF